MTDVPSYRLSPQQARVFNACPTASAHVVATIPATLDGATLRAAVDAAVARHEILRTVYVRTAGLSVPLQTIHDTLEPLWEMVDGGDAEVRAAVEAELPVGVAMAVTLVRNPSGSSLIIRLPAMSADAMSLGLLVKELAGAGVVEEPLQYADFAQWQHELYTSGDDAAAARSFWEAQGLEHLRSPALPFSSDVRSGVRSHLPVPLDSATIERLHGVASRSGADVETFLLAAWVAVVMRFAAVSEAAVAVVADARHHADLDGALGLFARSVPVVAAASDGITFVDLVQQVRRASGEAMRYQDYLPLDAPDSGLSIAFAWDQPVDTGGFSIAEILGGGDQHDVRLVITGPDRSRPIALSLVHDALAYPTEAATQLASSYSVLLSAAIADPSIAVSRLPILDAAARTLLAGFNPPSSLHDHVAAIHHRFEDVARRRPDEPAVVAAGRTLTYGALNEAANRVAHRLVSLGVGRDVPVGLCLDRSPELIVGLLGILKAGGAYVPLHPEHPRNRLVQQLLESKAPVLVTDSSFLGHVGDLELEVVALDVADPRVNDQPSGNPERRTGPDDLAYVIYTSGSTGVPKGVAVTHGNVANYTQFAVDMLGAADDRGTGRHFAAVSAISTDLGNTTIFSALASGACLHLVPADIARDPMLYRRYVAEHPIDVLKITPSHLGALLASEGADVLPRQHLIVGGEALTWDLVERVSAEGTCTVTNHYGPTETTIGSCTLTVDPAARRWRPATVPIGRPIANTRVYVLDPHGEPVPCGVTGELCIAGAGVARGYLHRPELAVERFRPDPGVIGARMYRTGDLARWLPDGALEFLGRIDQQVKIRGHRVEPAEIEAALGRLDTVVQSAVIAREDRTGEVQLVAYLVAPALSSNDPRSSNDLRFSNDHRSSSDLLREHLAAHVPDHMIPQRFVFLDALPVTPSGKVDRRALPAPEDVDGGSARSRQAPATATEEVIAEVWAEVLGMSRVGATDNFFELGGHSLLATQVIARVRGRYSIALPLHSLFTSPTVAGLASAVDALVAESLGGTDADLEALLAELEGLTEEEAEALLSDGGTDR